MTTVEQSEEFKKAVEDSRQLKAKPSDDELLEVRSAKIDGWTSSGPGKLRGMFTDC